MILKTKVTPKASQDYYREQLEDRHRYLRRALKDQGEDAQLIDLLQQVDAALQRIEYGTYGLCQTCQDPIEEERLLADPLLCFCFEHLTETQQRNLEQDFYLASRVQGALLPQKEIKLGQWNVYHSYLPAGPVSGDYCDFIKIPEGNGQFLFVLGDVSGKGFSASMLMTHLHAMFRSLIILPLDVNQLIQKANRVFCESTLSTHYATLISGFARPDGVIEIANAGHWPSLLVGKDRLEWIGSTGIPIGLFCEAEYQTQKIQFQPGDTLLLYTDGLVEATNKSAEYGEERLQKIASATETGNPKALVDACLADLRKFLNGATQNDDLTLMAIQWSGLKA
jgi:sigma-B regulation protein RsbU (phosphoserine phosphatase)